MESVPDRSPEPSATVAGRVRLSEEPGWPAGGEGGTMLMGALAPVAPLALEATSWSPMPERGRETEPDQTPATKAAGVERSERTGPSGAATEVETALAMTRSSSVSVT